MSEQLGMFGDALVDACLYPQLSPASAYRYGCRCTGCAAAKARRATPCCQAEGCAQPHVKHRRWCAEHLPAPKPSAIRQTADCELCGRSHSWYESVLANNRVEVRDLYRRTCAGCRRGYVKAIQGHHLCTDDALRLIGALECELCSVRFAIDGNGRRHAVVDHDHACCPGSTSCGACVRGIICPHCNHVLGSLEHAQRTIGLDKLAAYLDRLRR